MSNPPECVILVPLKSFATSKTRLRASLRDEEVELLTRELATGVLRSTPPRPTIVLCDDPEVADFARSLGAEALELPGTDLNGAVQTAYDRLDEDVIVIVAHADLIEPTGLGTFRPSEGVTIYCDHLGEGTNVLTLPAGSDFRFQFGRRSRIRHEAEAARLNLSCHVVTDSPWRFDVDEPHDIPSPDSI